MKRACLLLGQIPKEYIDKFEIKIKDFKFENNPVEYSFSACFRYTYMDIRITSDTKIDLSEHCCNIRNKQCNISLYLNGIMTMMQY